MVYYFPVTGWRLFATEALVYSLLFGVITWHLGMNSYEKNLCIDTIAALGRRLSVVSKVNRLLSTMFGKAW
jgi:hypothetical protein